MKLNVMSIDRVCRCSWQHSGHSFMSNLLDCLGKYQCSALDNFIIDSNITTSNSCLTDAHCLSNERWTRRGRPLASNHGVEVSRTNIPQIGYHSTWSQDRKSRVSSKSVQWLLRRRDQNATHWMSFSGGNRIFNPEFKIPSTCLTGVWFALSTLDTPTFSGTRIPHTGS